MDGQRGQHLGLPRSDQFDQTRVSLHGFGIELETVRQRRKKLVHRRCRNPRIGHAGTGVAGRFKRIQIKKRQILIRLTLPKAIAEPAIAQMSHFDGDFRFGHQLDSGL